MIQDSDYRPDIDGYRALAVLAVIVHHFDKTWLPGGYLGVDVFFVISGFVISMSLFARKHANMGALLANFYARRLRRLLPSLVSCVLATSVCVWFVDPAPREALGSGIAALFGVANLLLTIQDVDYFTRSSELNAFTHTWSLGVEEQFYMLFPLAVWLLAKRDGADIRTYAAVLAASMLVSLILFVTTADAFPVFNYYQLPTRLWELAAGALAFLCLRVFPRKSLAMAARLAAIALTFAFILPVEQRVSGTLLAVAATFVLLIATPHCRLLHQVATQGGLRLLGQISYPLYLWHWSVLVISRFTIGVSAMTVPLQIIVMLALAWGSWRFIERPVRGGFDRLAHRAIIVAGFCAVLLSTGLLVILMQNKSFGPIRSAAAAAIPAGWLPLIGSGGDHAKTCAVDGLKRRLRPETIDLCTVAPTRPEGNTIWAFGDSHAGQLQAMLYAIHDKTGMGVHLVETPGTPFPASVRTPAAAEGDKIFAAVSPRFKAGDFVVLGRLFLEREGRQRAMADLPAWGERVVDLAEALERRGVRVVIFGPLPMFRFATITSCVRGLDPLCGVRREELEGAVGEVASALEDLAERRPNLRIFHPFALVCAATDAVCSPLRDGRAIFRDKDHLNVLGSMLLADPFLERLR